METKKCTCGGTMHHSSDMDDPFAGTDDHTPFWQCEVCGVCHAGLECRIITNDTYAGTPCVMSEPDFYGMCAELWPEADANFADAGPVVTSEQDIRDHCDGDMYEADCIEQFRAAIAMD